MDGGEGGEGGDGGGEGGGGEGGELDLQMHGLSGEHEPVLATPRTLRKREWYQTQPGGQDEYVLDVKSPAVLSDRSSAAAAASHSLLVEMRAPPQEPLSIM